MRQFLILLIAVALVQVPIVAQGSGCQSHSTVVGSVQPVKTPPPQKLPAKGPQYVLYWLMHHWCPSCQNQAEVIKAFRERYGHEVQVYAVPLSGSAEEVKRFLGREGLSTLPIAREASASFQANTHPVLVFRKAGKAYYRINGYTSLSELEESFKTFKKT